MERTHANILKQIEEGKVLLHGTCLDFDAAHAG
jgi:hypothetical protein